MEPTRTPTLPEDLFVSVVVPTHARAALLGRLLASLEAQDWPADRYEIIVVHNFTPDGTRELVEAAIPRSRVRMHYFRTDFSRPGPSRHFGAERARGDVLAFIDDDCQAQPGWISAGVAALRRGYGLVQGRTIPDPDQKRRLLEKTVSITGPTPLFETCNIFYAAEAYRAVGGFPEEFRAARSGEDTSLGWAVREIGYASCYSEAALVYHEVFSVSYWKWLNDATVLEQIPFLARRYEGFRQTMYLRIFFSRLTAAFDLFFIGAIGGMALHPAMFGLCAPYVFLRMFDRGRLRAPHLLVARFFFALPRAALMSWVLLVNSIRARVAVL